MTDVVGTLTIEMAANIARLTEDFAEAKRVVTESTGLIMTGVNEMRDGITKSMSEVNESIKGVQESFKLMTEAAVLGFSVESIVEGTRHVAEYADEVEKSSQKTGIAADSLQALQFAAKMSDISSQELDKALKKLAQAMEGASNGGTKATEAFAAVGLKASDLKEMKTEDVLAKIADAFQNSNDGAGKAAVAVELFGRAGTEMIPFLNKGSASIEELKLKAQQLGLVMGGETLEGAAQLHEKFQLMDAQIEGMHRRMSLQLAPAFTQITSAFSEASQKGGLMEEVFKGLNSLLLTAAQVGSYLAEAFNAIGITIGATAAAVVSAAHGDFTAAIKIMDMGNEDIKKAASRFEAFRDSLEKPVVIGGVKKEDEATNKQDMHLAGKGKKDTSKMQQYEEELAEMKLAAAGENQTREQQKESEIAYWVTIRDAATTSAADRLAIQRKISGETLSYLEMMKRANEEAQKAQIEGNAKVAESQFAISSAALKAAEETGQISKSQAISAEQAIQEAILKIKIDGITKQMAAISNVQSAAYIKLNAEKLPLENKAAAETVKASGDVAKAIKAENDKMFADFEKSLKPLTSAWDKALTGMLSGTMKWHKAQQVLLQGVLQDFTKLGVEVINTMIKDAAKKVMVEVMTQEQINAAQKTGVAEQIAAQAEAALKSIATYAAQAFAGVTAFLAPMMGPYAVAGAAVVSALVLAEGAHVASAAGGYDIPSGVNPLTQLHQNEMVLPASLADKVRNMTGGNSTSATFNVNALDSQSVAAFFNKHGASIVNSLRAQGKASIRRSKWAHQLQLRSFIRCPGCPAACRMPTRTSLAENRYRATCAARIARLTSAVFLRYLPLLLAAPPENK